MNLIPEEEFKKATTMNLAPMVDFLFLIVAVFATMAITRAVLNDTDVHLAKVQKKVETTTAHPYQVNISLTEDGTYKWLTEVNEFVMEGAESIKKELLKQQELGLIPSDPSETKVLLHIDRNTRWEPIAQVIFTVRSAGFPIHPVYE